jgi:hypothetical protein
VLKFLQAVLFSVQEPIDRLRFGLKFSFLPAAESACAWPYSRPIDSVIQTESNGIRIKKVPRAAGAQISIHCVDESKTCARSRG